MPTRKKHKDAQTTVLDVFAHSVESINKGVLVERVSSTDKEFHFQNWFRARLEQLGQNFEIGGRNRYPDFRMVATTEGYEVIVGYSFDLKTNELIPKTAPNPGAGREHLFYAWRLKGSPSDPVSMRPVPTPIDSTDVDDEDTDA